MNLILFTRAEAESPLPRTDPRAVHLLDILRRHEGDSFDAGILDGPRAKGFIRSITADALEIEFQLGEPPPPAHPITLLIGLPRPQTARKILQEATSLGVEAIHFARTERGEPSYAESKLWSTGEYNRHLVAGAEQAFTTRVPELQLHETLAAALDQLLPGSDPVALDNYEATAPLRTHRPAGPRSLLLIGSERGWSPAERDLIRSRRIPLLGLGPNVLRTETATVAAVALLLARREL